MLDLFCIRIIAALFGFFGLIYVSKQKEKYKLMINPVFWLIGSWLICLLLYAFSGIEYENSLSLWNLLYIVMFLSLFSIGFGGKFLLKMVTYFIGRKRHKKERVDFRNKNIEINMFPFFIVATVGLVIYIGRLLTMNVDRVFGQTVFRDLQTDWLNSLLLLLTSVSLVVWLYELAYAILKNKNIKFYGILSAIIYNLPSILYSGRDALMLFAVGTLIVFVYCKGYFKHHNHNVKRNRGVRHAVKLMMFGLLTMLIYLMFLSNTRYESDSYANLIELFSARGACDFPSYLVWICDNFGPIGKLFVNAVFYFSSQFSKLSIILNDYHGPYMLGLSELHYVSRRLGSGLDAYQNEILRLVTNAGASGLYMFWNTAIGYLIYDFGRIGALIVSYVVGAICGRVNNFLALIRQQSPLAVVFSAIICMGCYLTVITSPVADYQYIFPVLWMIVMFIFFGNQNKQTVKGVKK